MTNVCRYNPIYKNYKTNPYSDYTFFQKLDALAGGTPLEEISKQQEANIIASTNKTNTQLATELAAAKEALDNKNVKPVKIQLYIAIAIITVLMVVIYYIKKRS